MFVADFNADAVAACRKLLEQKQLPLRAAYTAARLFQAVHMNMCRIRFHGQTNADVLPRKILRTVKFAFQAHPFTAPCVSPPTTILRWNRMKSRTTGISASSEAANTHSQRVAYCPLSR